VRSYALLPPKEEASRSGIRGYHAHVYYAAETQPVARTAHDVLKLRFGEDDLELRHRVRADLRAAEGAELDREALGGCGAHALLATAGSRPRSRRERGSREFRFVRLLLWSAGAHITAPAMIVKSIVR
jgi:hypothetical protein